MSIFERISTLIKSNINDLISSAEDPEKILEQLIIDMRSQFLEARKQVAVAIADEKRLKRTFERETEISTLQAILAGDYVLPAAAPTGAAVGAAARELLAALLVTDPAARPGAADALAHAWLAPSSPGRASSPVRLLRRLLGGDGNGWRPRFELRSAAPPAVAASPLVECPS